MIGLLFLPAMIRSASDAAIHSNDRHTKVGASIARKNRDKTFQIVSAGFNLIIHHGDDAAFERPLKYRRVIHAEVMAIGGAARAGIGVLSSLMYISHPPCLNCATLIRAAGIKTIVIGGDNYQSDTPETRADVEHMLHGAVRMISLAEALDQDF